jgi:cell division transport system ATP-binding protein
MSSASRAVTAAAPLLRFEGVGKRYAGGQEALRELSFDLDRGEMVFVTGHSGAGKSTLLRLIHLSERPSRGSVLFDGRSLAKLRPREVPYLRRRIGMVFQDHRLLLDRSLFDNVALPLLIAGLARPEIDRRVRTALDRVGLLGRERSLPTALSAGEQQRVGIARAIVAQPPLLVADEPTGNLDPQLAEDIMRLFAELPAQGTAVLVASHDLHLVRRMGRRVLVLDHGQLVDDFRPAARP